MFLWLVLIAYLLPDGHAASPRQRTWIRLGLVGNVVFLGRGRRRPGYRSSTTRCPVPWLPPGVSAAVGVVGLIWVVVFFFGSVVSVLRRLRRSTGDDRLRLLWFLFGALSVPVALLLNWASYFLLDDPTPRGPVRGRAGDVRAAGRDRHRDRADQVVRHRARAQPHADVRRAHRARLRRVRRAPGTRPEPSSATARVGGRAAPSPSSPWLPHRPSGGCGDRIERWVYGYRSEPHRAIRMMSERVDAADPPAPARRPSRPRSPRRSRSTRAWVEQRRTDDARDERGAGSVGAPRHPARIARGRGPTRARLLCRRHPAAARPGATGCGPGPRRAAQRRPPGLPVTARHRARGGAQAAAPRPARRPRAVTGRDGAQAQRSREPAPTPPSGTPCSPRSARRSRTRSPRSAGSSTTFAHRRSTRSASSARLRQRAAALSTETLAVRRDRTGLTATRAGRGRGRCVPDRLRGHDQRRQALRRQPLHASTSGSTGRLR